MRIFANKIGLQLFEVKINNAALNCGDQSIGWSRCFSDLKYQSYLSGVMLYSETNPQNVKSVLCFQFLDIYSKVISINYYSNPG